MKLVLVNGTILRRAWVLLAALACLAPPHAAAEERPWWAGRLRAGTGFEFNRGHFGESKRTDTWSVPFSVKYVFEEIGFTEDDEIELRVGFPYQRIKGPDGRDDSASNDDVGDPSITAGYTYLPESPYWPVPRFRTRVKLPTAFENEDLGSDRTDVTFEGDLFQSFQPTGARYPRIFVYGGVGYRLAQDAGSRKRRDGPRADVGGGVRLTTHLSVSADYSWRTTTNRGPDSQEIVSGFSVRLPLGLKVGPYAVAGLSSSAPDWGVGLSLSATFDID